MEPSEAAIQQKIMTRIRGLGGWVIKAHQGGYGRKGTPDLVGTLGGRGFGIEVKRPTQRNHTTGAQRHELRALAKAGGLAMVMWDERQVSWLAAQAGLPVDSEGVPPIWAHQLETAAVGL